jgi:predicted ArsR family transcriptional regulator
METAAPPGNVHRALADERRVRILDELRQRPAGLDVRELGERLELHPNTIRWHLGILADAGLVNSRAEGRTTPGRPRVVYTLAEEVHPAEGESYRLLATILGGTLAGVEDGRARAESEGAAWGRYLVRHPPPHARLTDAEAVQEVADLLAQQGFRPEIDKGEIRMRRCPFRELAESDDGLVCAVHRGIISGALRALGSDLDVERLDTFVEPELCIARLRRLPSAEQ